MDEQEKRDMFEKYVALEMLPLPPWVRVTAYRYFLAGYRAAQIDKEKTSDKNQLERTQTK